MARHSLWLDPGRVHALASTRGISIERMSHAVDRQPRSMHAYLSPTTRAPVRADGAAALAELLGVGTLELVRCVAPPDAAWATALAYEREVHPGPRLLAAIGPVARGLRYAFEAAGLDDLVRRVLALGVPYLAHVGGVWPTRGFVEARQPTGTAPPRFLVLRITPRANPPIVLHPDPGHAELRDTETWIDLWVRRSRPEKPSHSLRFAALRWDLRGTEAVSATRHFAPGPIEGVARDVLELGVWLHDNGRGDDEVDEYVVAAGVPFDLELTELTSRAPPQVTFHPLPHQRT